MNGIFNISLDFELHWGGVEKWQIDILDSKSERSSLDNYNKYFINARRVIPQILQLFEKYEIHTTWAAVGMLLANSKAHLFEHAPIHKPTYKDKKLSAYDYIEKVGIGDDEDKDPFHYAPSIIKKIIATPNQELGTHTFAHYYCNEEGQTIEQFKEDLTAAKRMAKSYQIDLKSMVFPRNQFNDRYLEICFQEGITSVRSNPPDWFWHIESTQHESLWKRLNRGLDAYFPIGKKNTYSLGKLSVKKGFPICLPASRLLRPYRPGEYFLNDLKLARIKSEMERAAKSGEVYHIWWHPHNFGNYSVQNLAGLEQILQHYTFCADKFKMRTMTMRETADFIFNTNGKPKAT